MAQMVKVAHGKTGAWGHYDNVLLSSDAASLSWAVGDMAKEGTGLQGQIRAGEHPPRAGLPSSPESPGKKGRSSCQLLPRALEGCTGWAGGQV